MNTAMRARLLTALVGIPLVLALVQVGGWPFFVVALGLSLISLRELELACRAAQTPLVPALAYPVLVLLVAAPFLITPGLPVLLPWRLMMALPFLLVVLLLARAVIGYGKRPVSLQSLGLTVLATFYVGLWAFLPLLRRENVALIWLVLAGVWGGDTLAFFAGRAFGKHKLTPLSPGKTVEGVVASVLASVAACLVVALWANLGVANGLALGVIIGVVAPLGDLAESFWKRELGVKDLGRLLPGHGGVLDRCDSLLFSAFAAYLYWLMRS